MPIVSFSGKAKTDLLNVGAYTLETSGEAQAIRYLNQLEDCANTLAANPAIGRECNWIRPGLRRFETGRHVIFYRSEKGGILVVRILQQSMMPDRHRFEEPPA
ncbi:MAG: type II toxin-antitoxin system RelE/ParE family toxin [Terracidiphilus sp.]|jgi:toxin ParE1/3/4